MGVAAAAGVIAGVPPPVLSPPGVDGTLGAAGVLPATLIGVWRGEMRRIMLVTPSIGGEHGGGSERSARTSSSRPE
jgi:hypothetical protein